MKKILVLLLTLCLTGCMKMNMDVNVDKEGQATLNETILVSEDLISSSGSTKEQLIQSFKDQFTTSDNVKVEEISETYEGVNYVGIKATNDKDSSITVNKTDDSITVILPIKDLTSTLDQYGMNASTLSKNYTTKQLEDMGFELKFVIHMPYTPTSQYGTIDGNTVTFDVLDLMNEKSIPDTLEVSCKIEKESSYLPYIIGIGGILIIIILYLRKRGKKND